MDKLKFNYCPDCGEKSKFKLKDNRDNADKNEKRYYCKNCSQIFTNVIKLKAVKE